MKISQLDIWREETPDPWIRRSVDRWADLMIRISDLYLGLFAASPVSRTEMEILVALFRSDGERDEPTKLADRFHVSKQTMTGLLDRLEKGGYIRREPHPDDRRRKFARISEKGIALVAELGGKALRRDAMLARTHDRGEVEHALEFLERLCSQIEEWNKSHPIR